MADTPASAAASTTDSTANAPVNADNTLPGSGEKPTVVILIGMAGTGKTTVMQRLNAYVHERQIPSYIINLDPAVTTVPYSPNIDIRDSVKYKEVMKSYNLGPNGGILTSLNLFATRFDQVMNFVDKRADKVKYVFVDTPGQIEVFNWSASGSIITESFASTYPTVIVYLVDTPRSTNPTTFMSNMLYACSMLYKTKLPLILLFNKIDIVHHEFAVEWMKDFDKLEEAARAKNNYMGTFTQSMGLMLQEFYNNLNTVGCSAISGQGFDEFFEAIDKGKAEYETDYKEELKRRVAEKEKKEEERQKQQLERVKRDIEAAKAPVSFAAKSPGNVVRQTIVRQDEEEGEDELYGDDDDEPDEEMTGLSAQYTGFMAKFK